MVRGFALDIQECVPAARAKRTNRPAVGIVDAERFTPLNHGRVIVPDEERRAGLTVFTSFPIRYQTECPECGGILQENDLDLIECQGCPARWQAVNDRYYRQDDPTLGELRRQRWGLD